MVERQGTGELGSLDAYEAMRDGLFVRHFGEMMQDVLSMTAGKQ